MAKKILVIDDKRWNTLHDFEHKQKELFLKKLTMNESLNIFQNLYQFSQTINCRRYYNKLGFKKINTLSKVHFMFMKV